MSDEGSAERLTLHSPHDRRHDGKRRLERRVGGPQVKVLVEHSLEATEVRARDVAGGTLTLLHDGLKRSQGGLEVAHRLQLLPPERVRSRLRPGWTDEQPGLAEAVDQAAQTVPEGAVQLTLGDEGLRPGLQLARRHRRRAVPRVVEGFGVLHRHIHRALEEHEVPQRVLAERQQRELDRRRVTLGAVRIVGAGDIRCGSDRGQQVVHHRPMQHLLRGDGQQHTTPAFNRLELADRESWARMGAQAEGRVQVLPHGQMFDLRCLAQQVRQFLAVLDHDRCRGHGTGP